MAAAQTNPKPKTVAEKRRDALELRKAGVSYAEIAKRLGYRSRGGAHGAVQAGLKAAALETPAEARRLELERLDRLLLTIWPKTLKTGEVLDVDRVLKIIEQRAKLLGLHSGRGGARRSIPTDDETSGSQGTQRDEQDPVPAILAILADIGCLPARLEDLGDPTPQ